MMETLFQSPAVPEHVAMPLDDATPPRGPGPIAAAAVLVAAVAGLVLTSSWTTPAENPILAILLPQLAVLTVITTAMGLGRWQAAGCGMSRPPLRTLLIGLTLVPLILCIGLALFALVTFVLGPPPEDIKQIDVTLAAIRSAGGWGLLILLVCVLPGIVEEALMRGVVLSGLRRRFSAPAAVVATALLFAAMHGSPWRFMPQLALGLAAGWLAVRSGSCWPGAVTHATYNAVVVASALPAP